MSLELMNTNSSYCSNKITTMGIFCILGIGWVFYNKMVSLNNDLQIQTQLVNKLAGDYEDFKKSTVNLYKREFLAIHTAHKSLHDEITRNIVRIDHSEYKAEDKRDRELFDLNYIITEIENTLSNNDNEKTQMFRKLRDDVTASLEAHSIKLEECRVSINILEKTVGFREEMWIPGTNNLGNPSRSPFTPYVGSLVSNNFEAKPAWLAPQGWIEMKEKGWVQGISSRNVKAYRRGKIRDAIAPLHNDPNIGIDDYPSTVST